MKSLAVSVCALGLLAVPAVGGGDAYYIDDGGLPWGDTLLNDAMNMVFGGGGWNDADYGGVDVGQLFSADTDFIYMEGSDGNATGLNGFLGANQGALEDWVADGGRLMLIAAPNQGGDMNWGFGGVTLNYDGANDYSAEGHAVDPAHPIFNGPFGATGNDFTGNFFGHALITGGGSDIITNENGATVLSEFGWGSGFVMVGGMTSPVWNDPNGLELRANMISHISTVIPAPGVLALLGLGGLVASRRRRR